MVDLPHEYEALRKTVDRELLKTPLDQSVQHGNVKTTIFIFTYIHNQQLTTMWEERVLLWTSALKFSCAHRIGCALLAKYDALQVFLYRGHAPLKSCTPGSSTNYV